MHSLGFWHKWFADTCWFIHAARLGALARAVDALLRGRKLSLTHLGRHRLGWSHRKHHIKAIDRLLGNRHLVDERIVIHRELARWLLAATVRPVIAVDWSDCGPGRDSLMLKAAVVLRGRAIPLYGEVHPLSAYNNPGTHRRFLLRLRFVLPEGCRPILVTDAGFRGPWFKTVETLGWDWVGRVRNRVQYTFKGTTTWRYTTALYRDAPRQPENLGIAWLSKQHPYRVYLHRWRPIEPRCGRRRKTRRQAPRGHRHREPWLIATSLPPDAYSAARVMNLYAKRMQIEETFRDLKGHRWGLGLQYARSRRPERLEVLLLIAMLALVVLWLLGLVAVRHGWARHFQANTERRKPVLSTVFLGNELLRSERFRIRPPDLVESLRELPCLVHQQSALA